MIVHTPGHASSPAWPEGFGRVLGGALPPALLGAIVTEAQAVSKSPNFWSSRERIRDDAAQITACEAAIRHLETNYMQHVLPDAWMGAEWWIQIYEHGRGLAFHFDKDEHLLTSERKMVHPIVNSIVYLTGDSASSRLGPTVVVDQQHCSAGQEEDTPRRSLLAYPRKNNFMMFDGRLGHGVLDTLSGSLRMTLLVNWWHHKPMDIQELTPDIARRHGLSLKQWPMPSEASVACAKEQLSNLSLHGDHNNHKKEPSAAPILDQNAISTSHGKDPKHNHSYQYSAQPGHERSTSSSIFGQQRTLTTSQRDAEALDSTSAEPLQHGGGKSDSKREHPRQGAEALTLSQATSVPGHRWLPCSRVATPDAAVSDFITVDGLLEGCKVHLTGSRAVDAVAIEHPGFALWPMADKESQESAELETTAAVLIPDHMLPESGSDEGSLC